MEDNPFNIQSIHHNAYATSNMAATIRFWRDLLGFKMVLSYDVDHTSQYFFCINQVVFISFFYWKSVTKIPNKRHGRVVDGAFVFDHTALQVDHLKDLQLMQNKFLENDLPITDIIDHGFIYSVYTFDPNGIPLEFTVVQDQNNLNDQPNLTASEKKYQRAEPNNKQWRNPDDTWSDVCPVILKGEGFHLFKK